jgi:hypothetical protein
VVSNNYKSIPKVYFYNIYIYIYIYFLLRYSSILLFDVLSISS